MIHCSDGVYEEYSTDEEEIEAQRQAEEEKKKRAMIDPKSLPWSSRVLHYLWMAGSGSMYYFDSWGERLAWFFGITSPKYYWEMQEFKRMKEEEEERRKKEAENTSGWNPKGDICVLDEQPTLEPPSQICDTSK